MISADQRPSPESLLAKLKEGERASLRVYIGAAPGVGKTYQMLEDAHQLKREGVDIVVGIVEPHGREATRAMIGDLECVPMRRIEYKGVVIEEMDLDAVIARRPAVAIVDELAHTNIPGSKNRKRYEDVIDLLNAGISVISAVNIQHLESLNDAVARTTGVRVRETIPDHFLRRADEVVNVDVSVDTLRTRLRQGKIYDVVKIQQALNNFFRKGNLSALRELALRQVATDQATKAHDYREREGLEQAAIPEKVMVAIASRGSAKRTLRAGSRIAGRLASDWYVVYVETPPRRAWSDQSARSCGTAREHSLRQRPGRKGRQAKRPQRGGRTDRFCPARRNYSCGVRTISALALGLAVARFSNQSISSRSARCNRAGSAIR